MLLMLAATGSTAEEFPDVGVVRHVTTRTSAIPRVGAAVAPTSMRSGTSKVAHTVRGFAEDLRLVYTNEYPIPIVLRAALHTPGHRRATFAGSETVTVPSQGSVASDLIDVRVRPGQQIWTSTYTELPSSGDLRSWEQIFELAESRGEWTGVGDLTASGASASTVVVGWGTVRGPTRILGATTPDLVSVAFGGDSIVASMRDSWPAQWAEREGVAWTSYAQSGEAAAYMQVRRGARYGDDGVEQHTHYHCQYVTNDLGYAWTVTAANLLEHWAWVAAQGVKVIQSTCLPRTSSTDNWATLANQTVSVFESVRLQLNAWLRDGAPIVSGAPVAPGTSGALRRGQAGHPLWKLLDVAPIVEVSGGLWRVDQGYLAGDGLHPSKLGHDFIAANIPTGVFA